MTTTSTLLIDPRVAKEIDDQISAANSAIAEYQAEIAESRVASLGGVVSQLQAEIAFREELERIRSSLVVVAGTRDGSLALLAQMRYLGEEAIRVAEYGQTESREVVESQASAIRAISQAVYYALHEDLTEEE